tara:strand:+ start:1148 stop:1516 length:369 start_codon:yes stop_codon:yes gene_type:complete
MVVGALQPQRAQHAIEALAPPIHVACPNATRAGYGRTDLIGSIGVEPLLDGAGRNAQRFTAGGGLDRLQVPVLDAPRTYEPFDFGEDLRFERGFKAPFLAASSEAASGILICASAQCSQACQ